jgi:hypothetical protein
MVLRIKSIFAKNKPKIEDGHVCLENLIKTMSGSGIGIETL